MKKRLFGSTGIRGRVFGPIVAAATSVHLTPKTLVRLGQIWTSFNAISTEILSGRDPRKSSEMVQSALNAGIMAMGSDVIMGGIIPTPALNYSCKARNTPGLMITGSHTPPEMNAVKFILQNGAEIDTQTGELEIESMFFDPTFSGPKDPLKCGSTTSADLLSPYLNYLSKNITTDLSGLTLILDSGNGCMAGGTISNFLSRHGANVLTINEVQDGLFPGRGAEPLLPESLHKLSQIVVQTGADLGIAYDSDGDRSIFIDDKGRMIWGDYTLALIAKHLLRKGDALATPVSTAGIIEDVADIIGFKIVWTAVGAAEVTRECLERDLPLGGEQNGGIIFPNDNPARDGGRTTIELLKLLIEEQQSLSALVNSLPKYYITKEKISHSEKLLSIRSTIMEEIIQHFSNYETIQIDGLKLQLNDTNNTSCLMRFSLTEPIFRVFTNSKDEQTMHSSHQQCVNIIKKIIGEFESKIG
ncbi:MAG: hypothetical protein ACE5R6_00045 [Candidatus Heimdallarchaeota archaeon]